MNPFDPFSALRTGKGTDRDDALRRGARRAAVQAQVDIDAILDEARARSDAQRQATAAGHHVAQEAETALPVDEARQFNELIRAVWAGSGRKA